MQRTTPSDGCPRARCANRSGKTKQRRGLKDAASEGRSYQSVDNGHDRRIGQRKGAKLEAREGSFREWPRSVT